ncbi:hypothetical protein JKP88DRAFT_353021 [Tribonema minus]|uniref:Uncharacterized protein n=1 Tax=Tribonema minus TaxID=303371 RepID=A0A835ZAD5_9STRA|nr:hypothetical protein JKP88DRAFT_353021 [Tribonema minus]
MRPLTTQPEEQGLILAYLQSWAVNGGHLAVASARLLAAIGKTLARRLPLLWDNVVFEVAGLPEDLSAQLVLSQEPYAAQALACQALKEAGRWLGHWAVYSDLRRKACSFELGPVPGRVLSLPCAAPRPSWLSRLLSSGAGSSSGGDGGGGACACAGGTCFVAVGAQRAPEILVQGAVARGLPLQCQAVSEPVLRRVRLPGLQEWAPEGLLLPVRVLASLAAVLIMLHAEDWAPEGVLLPVRALASLAAVLIVLRAEDVAESRAFHFVLSAVVGCAIAALVVGYVAFNLGRKLADAVPGVAFARSAWLADAVPGVALADAVPGVAFARYAGMAALLSAPLGAAAYAATIHRAAALLLDVSLAFWHFGAFGVAWLGKLYFAGSALAGVLVTWRWGLLREPAEGGGWRALLNAQANVQRAVTAVGLALLLASTTDVEAAAAIAGAALLREWAAYIWWRARVWYDNIGVAPHCEQIGHTEYEMQGRSYTDAQIAKLRAYIQKNPLAYRKVKPSKWSAMDHFRQGFPHVSRGGGDACEDDAPERAWRVSQ